MENGIVKIALWQTVGHPADVSANLAALEPVARQAADAGAALLLCPECWLCGYNIGPAVQSLAQTADGPAAQRIAAIARQYGIAIGYGYAERDPATDRIFNAAQVIGPNGVLAQYRKIHLFGPEERAAYCAGHAWTRPFEFRGFSIGLLICYDVEYPEAVRTLALMGADIILVPTALTHEYGVVPDCIVPARCIENRICIAYCNHGGRENGLRFLGRSCLIGPDGGTLAAAAADDGLIIGEIERPAFEAAGLKFPYRSDRRPELYGLLSQDDRC